jgi:broad specificity phosphatase PhoE
MHESPNLTKVRSYRRNTLLVLAALTIVGCVKVRVSRSGEANASAAVVENGATTIVVVRHAEKSTDHPTDPSLSALGQERAQALSEALKDAGVSAIYATQYKRTRQTAEPLAQHLGISIMERTVSSSPTYAADLARMVLTESAGKTVLIVGHSNTVPQIVQAFSGTSVPAIQDREYDHLFVVVVPRAGPRQLVTARFGRSTP